MKTFMGKDLLLRTKEAKALYKTVSDLPIIDYHCHLDCEKIAKNASFSDIGELWLAGDHYKWRAMRLCGVDEKYITGDATFKEKFLKYAEILPRMAGNALYVWSHMELSMIFGINEPLCAKSAERIYDKANEVLKTLTVKDLLDRFNVAYIATTDDPVDSLSMHGKHGNTFVCPTFRPDKLYAFDDAYIASLAEVAGGNADTLDGLLACIENRLDYFVERGCLISDHGFEKFPKAYATKEEADALYQNRASLTAEEKDKLLGYLLVCLTKAYAKRGILMQIHFSVIRNNNPRMFKEIGVDAGFDLISETQSVNDLVRFLAQTDDSERPETVLYTLADSNLAALTAVTGAFRHVRMGAAWWFNDTVCGIRRNLGIIAEYAALGEHFGMLTDSRSFSSYVRFDFFRRILCDYLGELVHGGEYDLEAASEIAYAVCFGNIGKQLSK
ncbi:MAG: glucuronate isomerase [Clostridia bacterium]|nr:glucuronate isomerase [Clostridia bacterium]